MTAQARRLTLTEAAAIREAIKAVAAEDSPWPRLERAVARQALADMDRTGDVDGAYRRAVELSTLGAFLRDLLREPDGRPRNGEGRPASHPVASVTSLKNARRNRTGSERQSRDDMRGRVE